MRKCPASWYASRAFICDDDAIHDARSVQYDHGCLGQYEKDQEAGLAIPAGLNSNNPSSIKGIKTMAKEFTRHDYEWRSSPDDENHYQWRDGYWHVYGVARMQTKTKTLYTVKVAYFTDHHPHHQGWEGKGWYWYLEAKGCDELYGPFDEQNDAVEAGISDAGDIAKNALQIVDNS